MTKVVHPHPTVDKKHLLYSSHINSSIRAFDNTHNTYIYTGCVKKCIHILRMLSMYYMYTFFAYIEYI